jgi:hypothetical protein
MLQLPSVITEGHRPATEREVHSRSFGQLKTPRNPTATAWEQQRGTLDDQAIFGPLRDFECCCGKYRGAKYQNMICDRCGVKLTTSIARRQRFGHIDLPVPVVHPFGQSRERLSAIPVLPAAFVESGGGKHLADLYEELVRWVSSESLEELVGSFNRLLELLLPIVIVAHEWNLQEAEVLTCGMALVPRVSSVYDICLCGNLLEGLDVPFCPGCGKKLR